MSTGRKALDAAIQDGLQSRLAALRAKPYSQLALLPEAETEHVTLLGKRASFTVYREEHSGGRLLILVRSDRPIFLGLGSMGRTEGFWVDPSGQEMVAVSEEISEFFS